MDLEAVFSAVSKSMMHDFEVRTAQYSHRGLRGFAREDLIKEFLANYLPSNLEIASGEIFDVSNSESRDSDVIVFDRFKVPFMFSGSNRLIPVEGVYSVIEVKSNSTSPELNDCLSKCTSLKNMKKQAFFSKEGLRKGFNVYDQNLDNFPILFSIIAFHGTRPERLISRIEEFCREKPLETTLDSILCLDGWIICWWNSNLNTYQLTASEDTVPAIVEGDENILLFFYLLYYTLVSQAECEPINMLEYAQFSEELNRKYP